MKPFHILIIILVSILLLSTVLIIKGDVLAHNHYKPPSQLYIREVDVKPTEVTSSYVRMNVTAYINYMGNITNAFMLIRAINKDTGLLETRSMVRIPDEEESTQKTMEVSHSIKVRRTKGYELKLLIFENGSILDSGSVSIYGLDALTPESKLSWVVLSNIDFSVSNVSLGKVVINADIYLENRASNASENLKMVVKAREASSNLIADKTISETGIIQSEATVIKSVKLVVPEDYNYMVVVELWRGDVMINTWEKPVLLSPTKTLPKESVEKKMKLEVSKFVREKQAYPAPATVSEYVPGTGFRSEAIAGKGGVRAPGFGVILAIAMLLLIRWRLSHGFKR